ncbi:winged helix-turn-helix transcriptional regulator [Veillonella caviae]
MVEYSLSDLGNSLMPILDAVCKWGGRTLYGMSARDIHLV